MSTHDPKNSLEPIGRSAVASYVATLSADLSALARRSGLDTISYLLEMVRLEAENAARQGGSPARR